VWDFESVIVAAGWKTSATVLRRKSEIGNNALREGDKIERGLELETR